MDLVDWMNSLELDHKSITFCKRFDQDSPLWNLDRHTHDGLELMFFLRGEATIDTSSRVLSTTAYDMVAYLPHHEHQETVDLSKSQEIICIWLDCGAPPAVRERSFRLRDSQRTLEWLFVQLEQEYRGDSPYNERLVDCYLTAMMQTVARQLEQRGMQSAADSIDRVYAYIAEHFAQPLTVEFLAELCHVSPSYLHRMFRRRLGMSPIQCINNLRIKEAEYLLRESDMTVSEIAERCGFDDSRYFSRIFRKKTAMAPSQYRVEARRETP